MGSDLHDVDVSLLRERRGSQKASFDEIADHMVEFVDRYPQARGTIERLAVFLAGVEGRPHAHEDPGDEVRGGGERRSHATGARR